MHADTKPKPDHRLTLQSRLDDLTLLWSWVDALAAEYAVPASTHFAIHLCLEEVLSNIIRHGYGAHYSHPITVECKPDGPHRVTFTIEDHAPPFDPLALSADAAAAPASIDELADGGRGLQLLRKFAGTLAYERLPGGNRLTIGFSLRG